MTFDYTNLGLGLIPSWRNWNSKNGVEFHTIKAIYPSFALITLLSFPLMPQAATEGNFIYGTREGCLVQLTFRIEDGRTLRWNGSCKSEYAEGEGILTQFDKSNTVITSMTGTMRRGKMVGDWKKAAMIQNESNRAQGANDGGSVANKLPTSIGNLPGNWSKSSATF